MNEQLILFLYEFYSTYSIVFRIAFWFLLILALMIKRWRKRNVFTKLKPVMVSLLLSSLLLSSSLVESKLTKEFHSLLASSELVESKLILLDEEKVTFFHNRRKNEGSIYYKAAKENGLEWMEEIPNFRKLHVLSTVVSSNPNKDVFKVVGSIGSKSPEVLKRAEQEINSNSSHPDLPWDNKQVPLMVATHKINGKYVSYAYIIDYFYMTSKEKETIRISGDEIRAWGEILSQFVLVKDEDGSEALYPKGKHKILD